ncbi:MotA/TolQ/ExbB proton channel family protein [Piscinibacter sp. Jin2]|uniref:Biopolymer transport protein ExbB n=1 Tax=Aquariibacter lacus TaxID=2801332 RepID=A0A9X1BN79_9BURK|nr:MotA/TolQ/ExbB proton channel family protein [Piscinibacter lacus]MBL0719415.1 MotA/TolQ/ExbB proton channel family protein [Piscinibacter lacus]
MPALFPFAPSSRRRAGRALGALALLALPLAALAQPEAASAAAPAAAALAVDNPYGLAALWAGSDWIAKAVLLMMALMSVGSWYILIVKLLEQARIGRQAREAQASFWSAGSVAQGSAALSAGSPFRFIAESALEATRKHEGLLGQIDLNEWVTMSLQRAIDRVGSRLQDGLAFLATVGSTAPFVGLFGTVWGIYHALTAIGVAGQASIDKVAGPVGESLIMTAIGLAVAVPAVLGYNWLVRRNKGAMDEVRAFGADLHAVLLASGPRAGRD